MSRRFPSLSINNRAGYETEGRENFEHVVQFNFDYSNVDATIRDVKKELSDFGYELNKAFSSKGLPKSRTGGTGFYLSPKSSADLGKADAGVLDSTFTLIPDGKQIAEALKPAVQQIGADGKATMLKYANRVETGRMRGAIRYNTRATKNKYTVNIGWTELWFKYFGFQENGTRTVRPMRSVLRTYLELVPRVQNYMSRFMRTYTRSRGQGVNYR